MPVEIKVLKTTDAIVYEMQHGGLNLHWHRSCSFPFATSGLYQEKDVTNISYTVPPNYRAGSDPSQANKNRNPNDPNMVTTGAYGSAFELALNTVHNSDGSTSETLTYQNYDGKTNGSFSAVSETGTGGDIASAYQSLLASMQANGEMNDATASQLRDAFNQLQAQSQGGGTDTVVSGGGLLVQAGGPVNFAGISAYQNNFVDSLINELTSELQHNSVA